MELLSSYQPAKDDRVASRILPTTRRTTERVQATLPQGLCQLGEPTEMLSTVEITGALVELPER